MMDACRERGEAPGRSRKSADVRIVIQFAVFKRRQRLTRSVREGAGWVHRSVKQRFAAKAFGRLGIAGWAQKKLERVPLRIHCPVKIRPDFLHFDVRLILCWLQRRSMLKNELNETNPQPFFIFPLRKDLPPDQHNRAL
jgi:hypothetical protein